MIDPMDYCDEDEVVCPYCGLRYECSYEFLDPNNISCEQTIKDIECESCGEMFDVDACTEVVFTSRKKGE